MWAEACFEFPIQVEGRVGESANHQVEVVWAEFGTGSSLAQVDREPGKDALDCPLSCKVLEAHRSLDLGEGTAGLLDNIALRGGNTSDRAVACWHHTDRMLVQL